MKKSNLLLALLLAASVLAGCGRQVSEPAPEEDHRQEQTGGERREEAIGQAQEEQEPATVSLVAVGDNIFHNTTLKAGKNGDGYDFTPFYTKIKPEIQQADIAVINQEAPMAKEAEPSGYPRFNAPQSLAEDLVETGFNVINQANNHGMDQGAQAVYDTIALWDTFAQRGIVMTGMYRDAEDRAKQRVLEKNGIRVGFLSYTYGTNGIPLPEDNPDLIAQIDREQMASELTALSGICDCMVVILHWGQEYQDAPGEEQQELARYLASLGADVIIGHHPHVIQKAEWVETPEGKRAFCAYSLGNFISSQDKPSTMLGGLLKLTIQKDRDGAVTVENPGVRPIVTYYPKGWSEFQVYPLEEYDNSLAENHYVAGCTKEFFEQRAKEQFGEFLLYTPLE